MTIIELIIVRVLNLGFLFVTKVTRNTVENRNQRNERICCPGRTHLIVVCSSISCRNKKEWSRDRPTSYQLTPSNKSSIQRSITMFVFSRPHCFPPLHWPMHVIIVKYSVDGMD